MSWPMLRKVIGDQRRSLIGWTVGIFVIVGALGALWPTVRDMPDITQFLDNYPEAVRDLFKIDSIATGPGYLNAELFSIILPAMFIIYGTGRGARLIAGAEETRQIDVLLAAPTTRTTLLWSDAAGLAIGTTILGVALFCATALTSAVLGMGTSIGGLAAGAVAMVAIGLEHGLVALAVGAATGRRTAAIAVAGALGVAGYVLYLVGELVAGLQSWQKLSPFAQVLVNGPLGGPVPVNLAVVIATGAAALTFATPMFERRDVGA